MEDKSVYGEAEILDNQPFGGQLKGLLDRNVRIGISSRGVGDMEVKDHGGRELSYVTEGYRFITWDAVAEPSVTGAILHLMENKNRLANAAPKRGVVSRKTYESILTREFDKYLKRNV